MQTVWRFELSRSKTIIFLKIILAFKKIVGTIILSFETNIISTLRTGVPLARSPGDFWPSLGEGTGRAGGLRGVHFRDGNACERRSGLRTRSPLSGNCSLRAWSGNCCSRAFALGRPKDLRVPFPNFGEVGAVARGRARQDAKLWSAKS